MVMAGCSRPANVNILTFGINESEFRNIKFDTLVISNVPLPIKIDNRNGFDSSYFKKVIKLNYLGDEADKVNPGSMHVDSSKVDLFIMNYRFTHGAQISNSIFEGSTILSHDTIERAMVFENCTFSRFSLLKCDFESSIYFGNCRFDGLPTMANNQFRNPNDRSVTFELCSFAQPISFRYNEFLNSTVSFRYCHLPDTINFYGSNPDKEVDLTNNILDGRENNPIKVNLERVNISNFKLDYQHFKLFFTSESNTDQREGMYESLLNNFKLNGQQESYKLADIEYQEFKYRQSWYTWPLMLINWAWWNFGYSKGLVFFWTAVFLFVFTCFSQRKLEYLNCEIYPMSSVPKANEIHTRFDKWWFSFIYTASLFFKLTLRLENLSFKDKRWSTYIILVYTIGVVCLAYMANFVLQK
jgi:uncharacterized protein YjbI with pentapeptide repeats